MNTIYHLSSAQDLNQNILDAIKTTFKSKPITIVVEENEEESFELTTAMITELDKRLLDSDNKFISSNDSIQNLKTKFGV
jgi:hypothetical protein